LKLSFWKRKKKKKDDPELTVFGEPVEEEEEESSSEQVRRGFRQVLSGLKPKRKIRLRFLLTFKRIIAGFLFIIYFLASLMLLPEAYAILFFATSFIMLDYLWKTRRIQWIPPDEKT